MWPFDKKKPPPVPAFMPEAIAKFRNYIPPPLPADYTPSKDLHIVPIALPLTRTQQHIRDELRAVVTITRKLEVKLPSQPGFDAFEAAYNSIGPHYTAAQKEIIGLFEKKPDEVEPGARVLFYLLGLHSSRVLAYAQNGKFGTPFSEDDDAFLAAAGQTLIETPMSAAVAAEIAGVKLDVMKYSNALLAQSHSEKQAAGLILLTTLWFLCVHRSMPFLDGE